MAQLLITIEQLASVCHAANKQYCEAIGDHSQQPWDAAPQWQKSSAVEGVRLKLANPDLGPAEQHAGWLQLKSKEGWKYGPVKDVEKKEHPCFLPYEELPPEQKAKDALFGNIVKALMPITEKLAGSTSA